MISCHYFSLKKGVIYVTITILCYTLFNAQNAGSFMAVSLIGLIVVLAIVLLTAKLQKHYKINIENPTEVELAQIEQTHKTKVISWIESFYEMVFSSTSVLIFLSLYYVLDERIPQAAYF